MNRQNPPLSSQSFLTRKVSQHFNDFRGQSSCRSAIDLGLSRRRFLGTAAGAAGLALASSLLTSRGARADDDKNAQPKPIPGGVSPFGIFVHHFPVLPNSMPLQSLNEPSQITDFKGFVGLNRIRGAGAGTGLPNL